MSIYSPVATSCTVAPYFNGSSIPVIEASHSFNYGMGGSSLQQKTLSYVVGEKLVSPIIDKIVRLATAFDKAFTSAITFIPLAGADNVGQISPFEVECPEGWVPYTKLNGRTPIGTGDYSGVREDGGTETHHYNVLDQSGAMFHTLTVPQMPIHNHKNGDFKHLSRVTGSGTTDGTNNSNLEPDIVRVGEMLPAGGDQAHNNMQPSLALNFCIKTVDEQSALASDLSALEDTLSSLSSNFVILQTESNTHASQDDLSSLASQVNALSSGVSSLQSESNTHASQDDLSSLESQVNALSASLNEARNTLNTHMDQANSNNNDQINRILNLGTGLENVRTSLENLSQRIDQTSSSSDMFARITGIIGTISGLVALLLLLIKQRLTSETNLNNQVEMTRFGSTHGSFTSHIPLARVKQGTNSSLPSMSSSPSMPPGSSRRGTQVDDAESQLGSDIFSAADAPSSSSKTTQ